jgi:hypothetical protein
VVAIPSADNLWIIVAQHQQLGISLLAFGKPPSSFAFEGKDEDKKQQMTVPMKQKQENSDFP